MKKLLLLTLTLLLSTLASWARTELEYTALTTGVDYVLMDNGKQYFLANGNKTNSVSAANKYQIVATETDGQYYLKQTSTNQYIATATSHMEAVTWTSEQASAEKFTISMQNANNRVRFVSTTNTGLFLNSQGNSTTCPVWSTGTGDWSYWVVYKYDFFIPTANKGYKLKMKGKDLYVKFSISGYTEDNAVNATKLTSSSYASIFNVSLNGINNTMKWRNEYLKTTSTHSWNSGHGTDDSNSTWYIEAVDGETDTYYLRRTSDNKYFGNDVVTPAADDYLYTDQTSDKRNIKWEIVETTMSARMLENGYWPETSTSESPKYYTIRNTRNGDYYAKYVADNQKMGLVYSRLESTANAFWFEAVSEGGLADDVLAVKIHNKAAGKCVAATNSFTNDGITWYLKADVYTGTSGSIAINKSSTVWNNNANGWNNESNNNLNIAPYASTDIGSTWWLDALTDDDLEEMENYYGEVVENIQPFIENKGTGYFKLSDSYASALSDAIDTANSDEKISADEYDQLMSILNGALTRPATGYYLLKSYYDNYIFNATGTVTTKDKTESDVTTIVRLEKTGTDTYKIAVQGSYLKTPTMSADVTYDDTGATFTAVTTPSTIGKVAFDAGGSNYGALHASSSQDYKVVGWTNDAGASQWTVEDISSVSINLTAANDNSGTAHTYATLCVPFAISNLTGANSKEVKAYAPTKSGDYIVPGTGATTVTEGTPVLLIGEEGATSVTATIGSNYASSPATTNVLTGTFTGTTIDCSTESNNYVLGFDASNSNRIGFYHVSEGSSFALGANRAYLKLDNNGDPTHVKGFMISFDEADAITEVAEKAEVAEGYFDLSGRRVAKPSKGLYIVGGRKVVIK